MKLKYLKKKRN